MRIPDLIHTELDHSYRFVAQNTVKIPTYASQCEMGSSWE